MDRRHEMKHDQENRHSCHRPTCWRSFVSPDRLSRDLSLFLCFSFFFLPLYLYLSRMTPLSLSVRRLSVSPSVSFFSSCGRLSCFRLTAASAQGLPHFSDISLLFACLAWRVVLGGFTIIVSVSLALYTQLYESRSLTHVCRFGGRTWY